MSLPYFVKVGRDPRGGVIHQAADGSWRANGQAGPLGVNFPTEEAAVAAIKAAPPKPKQKRAEEPEPPLSMLWTDLTDKESGFLVFDARGRKIGAVIRVASDRFAAWTMNEKVGEFPTMVGAERAVRNATRTRKARA
jgi:hypothetical protein